MEALERSINSNDWITVVFLLSLLCLVFAKSMFEGRFLSFIILPFNNKYIFLYNKKGRLLHGFHLVQSLFLLLNLSLFLLLAFPAFPEAPPMSNAALLLLTIGGLLAFFLVKLGLQLLVGLLFDIESLIAGLIYKKMTYLNYSSLVMFGANLILAYVYPASKPVVFISLFLILLINLIGWAGILKIHQKLIGSYFFYFILYLCALEMAPFLIIAYLLKD